MVPNEWQGATFVQVVKYFKPISSSNTGGVFAAIILMFIFLSLVVIPGGLLCLVSFQNTSLILFSFVPLSLPDQLMSLVGKTITYSVIYKS